jgi:hypothetical protein
MNRHFCAVSAVSILALGQVLSLAAARQEPAPSATAPALVKWNLDRLRKEPFKLIKATPDAGGTQVRLLLEFTRTPQLSELFDWEHSGGPVIFRFADEDGVVLRTIKPRLDGEFIAEKGARFRLILPMPDQQTLELVHSISAE